MKTNEIGIAIPSKIIEKATSKGSMKSPKYVYRDGDYGEKPPVASIGGRTTSRFGSIENAEEYKVELGEGWVAFKSPSAGKSYISEGKGFCEPCLVCGEDRITEGAHFPKPQRKGGTETIPLCPTHHKLLDTGRISPCELDRIREKLYDEFDSLEDFMKWAKYNGYDYSLENIKEKKVNRGGVARTVEYGISY
ncbi:MAG: hypothetical protein R6U61_05705 [Thermoplasmata archaeon]